MNNLGGQRLGDLFKTLPLKAICEPRNDHGRYFINLIVMVQIEINRVRVIVVNATFNNISVISWPSVIGGGNRSTWRKLPTCRKSLTNVIT